MHVPSSSMGHHTAQVLQKISPLADGRWHKLTSRRRRRSSAESETVNKW